VAAKETTISTQKKNKRGVGGEKKYRKEFFRKVGWEGTKRKPKQNAGAKPKRRKACRRKRRKTEKEVPRADSLGDGERIKSEEPQQKPSAERARRQTHLKDRKEKPKNKSRAKE